MKRGDYKLIFVVVGLIGVLLVASPVLSEIIRPAATEKFSELYLLGPEHSIQDYPRNVIVGQNYSFYVGVSNHLSSSACYVLYLKFKNLTVSFPNDTLGVPSVVSPLYENRFILQNGQTWESPVTFSISDAIFSNNQSIAKTLIINNIQYQVNLPASFDSVNKGFDYQIFFELWLYNPTTGSLSFNSRYVSLDLILTKTA